MALKNKQDVVDRLGIEDCRVHETKGDYTIRVTPTPPFAFLKGVPNYIVVNDKTNKIDFASDSASLCESFISMYGSAGGDTIDGLMQAAATGEDNGEGGQTLN